MSRDITTMLRHISYSKHFSIDQFTDRRINIWKRRTTWRSFEEMVEWKFRSRRNSSNGPSDEAAMEHYLKD
eukprot:2059373-Pyramimonas_sp.AAC.1